MRTLLLALSLSFFLGHVVRGEADPAATKALHAFLEAEWEYALEQNPTFASSLGDRRWNDRWNDVSLEAVQKRQEHTRAALERLQGIDRAKLSPADQLNHDLYRKELEYDIAGFRFRQELLPIAQQGGVQTADELREQLRFQTVKDYEDWLARLRALPTLVDQTIALLQEGVKEKIVWPRVVLARVPAQIDKQIVENPETSPFFIPFRKFPDEISEADRKRLAGAGREAIAQRIVPAMKKLKTYFTEEYLPAAPEKAGIWQWPAGGDLYSYLAARFTTTNLTPEEIHQRGLTEVARIRAGMEKIKEQVGFKGTLAEFFTKLRTDPQFFCKTPEELLETYRAVSKRIDPELVKCFKTMPRMPYGVTPIPANIAPDTTTAYYNQPAADGSRAGQYYVNLYKPETRPKWEMMALSLHEAVPGHHFQIALAQELGEIPKFRRYGYGYTAYVEGWGLYAESLGEEMGLYEDPYDKFGQLTYEMWRAVRLVVDTGLHEMKWDRQRAIDYFKENAAKAENDIVNEIDRYITNPGQALAYKIGEMKIKELRARATGTLGDRFDLREFHDVVLLSGAVPLDVLEGRVNDWVGSVKTGATVPR